jgi:hypothetical protein
MEDNKFQMYSDGIIWLDLTDKQLTDLLDKCKIEKEINRKKLERMRLDEA